MNLGAPEILLILVVALLVFGPHKLPEIGRQVGGAMRELRKMQDSVKNEIQSVMAEDKPSYDKPKTAPVAGGPLAVEPQPPVPQLEAPASGDDEPDHTSHELPPEPGFNGPSGSFS